jgi:hypothetical protein
MGRRDGAKTTTDLTQKRVSNPGHEHEETPGTRPLRSAGPCSQRMHACSNRAFRSTDIYRVYPKGTDKFQKRVPHTKTRQVISIIFFSAHSFRGTVQQRVEPQSFMFLSVGT